MNKTKQTHTVETARVWIEVERPSDDAEGDRRAALLNRMLRRLNNNVMPSHVFSWNRRAKRYDFGNEMGYRTLSDNGTWFSLDFFGRE